MTSRWRVDQASDEVLFGDGFCLLCVQVLGMLDMLFEIPGQFRHTPEAAELLRIDVGTVLLGS